MRVSARQYAQSLFELVDGKSKPDAEKAAADFARYIYKEGKLKLAGKIIEQFEKIYNSENDIIEAEAVTAQKLENSQVNKVKSFIEKKYRAKEVVLKNIVDEGVKGGIVLKVGDEVTDGSVRGKLRELKNILTK
ncbi:MAG TPA: ATP synthase F1 subunit delta [Candidatus Bathyarchaeia archaeon]|nr:ATP synthase F1 subunit delta [Candidatus Bathyarchaeia archaeon]